MTWNEGIFREISTDTIVVDVDETVYSLDALLKTCYMFTDRAYLYLCRERAGHVCVYIGPKTSTTKLGDLAGEFCNELIDYQVRSLVSRESGKIRELLVAQAFAEGNLLDEVLADAGEGDDPASDPLGIGDHHEHKG
jgi:His-Xaa-Ser system protein HxsD